jgi:hypothetical protein
MDKDIWIVKISDYRKWCVRLYVELYKGNEPYRNVYYDVRKGSWHYAKHSEQQNVVDFEELEEMVKPILIKEHIWDYSGKDLNKLSFKELSNSGYDYYGEHSEYKSKYNIAYAEMQERRKRLGW